MLGDVTCAVARHFAVKVHEFGQNLGIDLKITNC